MPVTGLRSRLRRHAPKAAAALVLGAVGVGPWLLGSPSDASTPAAVPGQVAGTSCHEASLRWGVTNRSDVRQAQDRFERSGRPVPEPGDYDRPLDPAASLHAVLHGSIVVYRRPGAVPAQLGALVRVAQGRGVPFVVSPRAQGPALVVLRGGAALTCQDAGAADVRAVRAFAVRQFAALR